MKILGKAYKDSPVLLSVGFIIIIGILIAASILFFIFFPDTMIFGILFSIFTAIMIICFIVILRINLTSKLDVLIYDEGNKEIIIHKYNKSVIVKLDDIKELKYRNKALSNIGPIFVQMEVEYGKIIIYLKTGVKVVTPLVDDVLNVYHELVYIKDTYLD